MAARLGRLLRGHLLRVRNCLSAAADAFPEVSVALSALESAVDDTWPRWEQEKRRRGTGRFGRPRQLGAGAAERWKRVAHQVTNLTQSNQLQFRRHCTDEESAPVCLHSPGCS